jgi:hypothetical protein
LPIKAVEGLHRLFELFSIIPHFLKSREKKDFCLAAIVDEDFDNVSSIDVDGDDHSVGVQERG